MRSQLLVSGAFIAFMGFSFYVLEIPLLFTWSSVLLAGGAVMFFAGFVVPERAGPISPPEGYRFCRFCSAAVPQQEARCPQCNGLQQSGGS